MDRRSTTTGKDDVDRVHLQPKSLGIYLDITRGINYSRELLYVQGVRTPLSQSLRPARPSEEGREKSR
jgi:hypothetical protein